MANPQITHERVDDIPLLVYVMHQQLGYDHILDEVIPRHGNWLGLSFGKVTIGWLTHILSESNHFMSHVEDWANDRPETLGELLEQPIRPTDFTDDRLEEVIRILSLDSIWHQIEPQVNQRMIRVYRLPTERIRLDPTTVSVDSHQSAALLFRRGHSKDHRPDLPQLKVMLAGLDPLGALLAADVVPGNAADDGLYVPTIERLLQHLPPRGLLFIGDCKMSALATRIYIHHRQHYYLTPLAKVGQVPEQLSEWIAQALSGAVRLTRLEAEDGSLWGEGYELTRPQSATLPDGRTLEWQERVLVVRSEQFAAAARHGLQQRLERAQAALEALTPPRGRGQRQYTEAAPLREAVEAVLSRYRVADWLKVTLKLQVERHTVRAYGGRPSHVKERRRYVVSVQRREAALQAYERTLGWRAYVTNACAEQLPLTEAVLAYCDEWLAEHNCARLKGHPLSLAPLWLTREDHAVGMVRLLSLAARVLAVVEYQVRQKLNATGRVLTGLFPGQPTRQTKRPTTERLLKAFAPTTLVIIRRGSRVERYLTPLTRLQKEVLRLLNCPASLYQQLAMGSG